jgi:hypothetical protein
MRAGLGVGGAFNTYDIVSVPHTMLALSIKCPEPAGAFSANAESSAKHLMQCKGSAGPGHLHSMLSAERSPSTQCCVLLRAHRWSVRIKIKIQCRRGGGAQVIGRAWSISGISKQPNAESPSIPKATCPNLTARRGRSEPIGRLTVLSAQSLTKH